MKKYISILFTLAVVALFGACSKDDPFSTDPVEATGSFSTASIALEVSGEETVVRAQADDAPDASLFNIEFFKEGETTPAASYKYSELPEIVTLPVGRYKAVAVYGENPDAAWDAPYYRGESELFDIAADQVTEVSDPIVCKFSNVKVTVFFDKSLADAMSADSKVSVKVGESGSLDFTKADEGRHGYFAFVENSHTLAATFSGEVQGYRTSQTKARDNVAPGYHYMITFSLRRPGEGDPGSVDSDIVIDATVVSEEVGADVDPDQPLVPDDMRPVEGGDEPDPGPGPEPGKEAPVIDAGDLDLNGKNEIVDGMVCRLVITSTAPGGFTAMDVDIDSNTLTPDELVGVGLEPHIDLTTNEAAQGLFAPDGQEKLVVLGQSEVTFDITSFLGLLTMLGPGDHAFKITATDANGTTVRTLRLYNN